MTDRPIIFSAPMILALLASSKTQTRRLASSPLRRCVPGDRLYVREHWKTSEAFDKVSPRDLSHQASVLCLADRCVPTRAFAAPWGRHRQGMHMPRWASRITLTVTDVRVERLQAISRADAMAEGVVIETADPPFYYVPGIHPHSLTGVGIEEPGGRHAQRCYQKLWSMLHTEEGQRWDDNPDVLALTFSVARGNIDAVTA